jgi:acyl-CoA synthetase (AMP-forming)/AMP-acid ligase II
MQACLDMQGVGDHDLSAVTAPALAPADYLRAIADYKAPRRVVFVDEVYRAPNGKADYRWAREQATFS